MIFRSQVNNALNIINFMRKKTTNNTKTMTLTSIAEGIDITLSYAEQLMVKIKKLGIVSAKRGPNGGYYLVEANEIGFEFTYEHTTIISLTTAFYPDTTHPEYLDDTMIKYNLYKNIILINIWLGAFTETFMTIELLNIDCMEYMKTCKNNAFDLAIVDPPYGINAANMSMGNNINRNDGWNREESTAVKLRKDRLNHGSGKLKDRALNTMNCDWDTSTPPPEYFIELFRVSKNQIIWGGNYFDLRPTRCIICWDKVQPWENFSQWELAWTSFDKPAAMFRHSNTGGANTEIKIHPTQKPRKLYAWVLDRFAQKGQRIIDTHSGSASLAIEAHYFGVDIVACEIDNDYYNASRNRFDRETKQVAMF